MLPTCATMGESGLDIRYQLAWKEARRSRKATMRARHEVILQQRRHGLTRWIGGKSPIRVMTCGGSAAVSKAHVEPRSWTFNASVHKMQCARCAEIAEDYGNSVHPSSRLHVA